MATIERKKENLFSKQVKTQNTGPEKSEEQNTKKNHQEPSPISKAVTVKALCKESSSQDRTSLQQIWNSPVLRPEYRSDMSRKVACHFGRAPKKQQAEVTHIVNGDVA